MRKFTQKDRLLAVARKQEVDKPPCICPGGMMNMISRDIMVKSGCLWPEAHMDSEKMAALTYALNEAGGFENYGVPFCMTVEAEAMGAKVNMGDLICEPHVVDSPLKSTSQVNLLKQIDVNSGRVKVVLDTIKILKAKNTDVPIIGNVTGPVSTAGTLVDMSVLMREFRKKPVDAEKLLNFIVENLVVYAKAQVSAGADVVCISEPSGTGEILGPKIFRDFTIKYVNRVLDAVDVPVKIVHICGKLKRVYQILPEFHCNIFSFDAIVPIMEIKPFIPEMAVMGNVSSFALGEVSSEKVKSLVKLAMTKGADVVAPACGLSTTTPLINIQTMVETTKQENVSL
ncbi:MtaA/CmuA family methyltransferase [Acetobacterium tundrae]|uniref:MtaA/CmuA family methyltransferase n=1 Tax=Acetobacterium tundrae TaxID=132932 RepID=A0ABR6WI68_9FIRM|nr:MtaA/CmuA family methyltransferase [Acetobacterium tundrae]MBC3796156.1 MtaA/CmuA family methyltransferase [Acetobacterium tundrae]